MKFTLVVLLVAGIALIARGEREDSDQMSLLNEPGIVSTDSVDHPDSTDQHTDDYLKIDESLKNLDIPLQLYDRLKFGSNDNSMLAGVLKVSGPSFKISGVLRSENC